MPIKLTGPDGKVRGIVKRSFVIGADGFISKCYSDFERSFLYLFNVIAVNDTLFFICNASMHLQQRP